MQNVDAVANSSHKAAADTSSPLSEMYTVYPLNLTDSNIVTGIEDVCGSKTVSDVKYYDISGRESDIPFNGVNIVVTLYDDGTKSTSKILK